MDVHVLLVQPDKGLGEVLGEILAEHGMKTRSAAAGQRLDLRGVDLVLAELPGKTADELRAFVKAMAPVPVGLFADISRESSGAAFVLRKPIDIDALLASIAEALALPDAPSATSQKWLVERYFTALARCDWDELGSVVHDNVVYNLPTQVPHGGIVVGRGSFLEYSAKVFGEYPEVSFDVERQLPLIESRIASYKGSWSTPSGRVSLGGHVVFGFLDGVISRVGVHLDGNQLNALRQSA